MIDGKPIEWWEDKAKKWVIGSNVEKSIEQIKKFNNQGYRVLFDSVLEESNNSEEILTCKNLYFTLINQIHANNLNAGIAIRYTNLGINYSYEKAKNAFRKVLDKAKEKNVDVEVNIEERSVVEKTVQLSSEMIEEGYSFRQCIQTAIKDTSKIVNQLMTIAKNSSGEVSFRVVTGSCYKETCELEEIETVKQFYKLMFLCGPNSAIGTHVTERLLCAKAIGMEAQELMGFEEIQPPGAIDTLQACFGDWRTNEGVRGYIMRREAPQ